MYVCVCRAITDSNIREAIDGGASHLEDLRDELGVASCCGQCAPTAQALIDEATPGTPAPAEPRMWPSP